MYHSTLGMRVIKKKKKKKPAGRPPPSGGESFSHLRLDQGDDADGLEGHDNEDDVEECVHDRVDHGYRRRRVSEVLHLVPRRARI